MTAEEPENPARDNQAMTVRLPVGIYEMLRREAFDRRVSQRSIIIEAMSERYGIGKETEDESSG